MFPRQTNNTRIILSPSYMRIIYTHSPFCHKSPLFQRIKSIFVEIKIDPPFIPICIFKQKLSIFFIFLHIIASFFRIFLYNIKKRGEKYESGKTS